MSKYKTIIECKLLQTFANGKDVFRSKLFANIAGVVDRRDKDGPSSKVTLNGVERREIFMIDGP